MTPFDPGVPFQDTAVAGFESGAAAKAFASLPERWQLVLWHLEVEGQKPADIAPLLGMSANSVSALAYRAREGLRQAFLTMHLADIADDRLPLGQRAPRRLRPQGAVQARRRQGRRTTSTSCRRCTAMYLELTEVNSNLAGIIAPLLLGAAATGYLASSGAGAAGVLGLVSRAKDFVAANAGAVTAAGVAAGVAAAATVAAVTLGGGGAARQGADHRRSPGVRHDARGPGDERADDVARKVTHRGRCADHGPGRAVDHDPAGTRGTRHGPQRRSRPCPAPPARPTSPPPRPTPAPAPAPTSPHRRRLSHPVCRSRRRTRHQPSRPLQRQAS